MRMLSKWCVAAACAALAGCEYTVPVAEKPADDAKPDAALLGAWTRTGKQGFTERLAVLPGAPGEWLVMCQPIDTTDNLVARAWPVRVGGMDLVQLRWIGNTRGQLPQENENKFYQFTAYSIEGDVLTVRLVAGIGADASTTRDLIDVLESHQGRTDFFREAKLFRRVKE